MSEAVDPLESVAAELHLCALAWVPEARLLGNVRAADIARLCEGFLEEDEELRLQIGGAAELRNLIRKLIADRAALIDYIVRPAGDGYMWTVGEGWPDGGYHSRESAVQALLDAAGIKGKGGEG